MDLHDENDPTVFTVPVIPLADSDVTSRTSAPKRIPVIFEGENVAEAQFREGNYNFRIFSSDLQQGLRRGTFLYRLKYRDSPPEKPNLRIYAMVEIIHNL